MPKRPRGRRFLLGGSALVWTGLTLLNRHLHHPVLDVVLSPSALLAALGAYFAYTARQRRDANLLIPGLLLLGFGLLPLANAHLEAGLRAELIEPLVVAVACFVAAWATRAPLVWAAAAVIGASAALQAAADFRLLPQISALATLTRWWPVAAVVAGGYLLLSERK